MKEGLLVEKTTIRALISQYDYEIPEFQRKLVWKNHKKEELIDSLIKSFPIGAITLFYYEKSKKYLVVDGLQRINTIVSYLKNPASIIDFKKFYNGIEDDVKKYCEKNSLNANKIKSSIKEWYSKIDSKEEENYKFQDFEILNKSLSISLSYGQFQELRDILIKNIDITNEELAIITYKGDIENLPELFAKINQRTVSLTSYEILHSLWYSYKLYTGQKTIAYKEKFIEMIKNSEDYDSKKINVTVFNMYMNLSAIGYILRTSVYENKEYAKYFKENKYNYIKSEIVFDIFSTLIKNTTNKINEAVDEIFKEGYNGKRNDYVLNLNEAIINCFKKLNSFLYENKVEGISSKYYYIYLFCIVFKNYYIITPEKFYIKKILSPTLVDKSMLDIEKFNKEKWFKDENRQIGFFIEKIKSLKIQSK